jgi:hypothetical protein
MHRQEQKMLGEKKKKKEAESHFIRRSDLSQPFRPPQNLTNSNNFCTLFFFLKDKIMEGKASCQ